MSSGHLVESMRICVVSQSDELPSLLRFDQRFSVETIRAGEDVPVADLYIWDCRVSDELRAWFASHPHAQQYLLLDPKDLDSLGDLQSSICVLLKPFAAFRMRAFVELAYKTWQLRKQVLETDSLRSDRDTLLQYVLEVNLKLQEYDQERNNFLARALHDFRAPLTALLGYCDLLSEGKIGAVTSAQRTLLERMRNSTRRLTRLAGGALELLSEGRFERAPVRNAGDIGETLSQAVHDVYPMAKEKGLELRIEIQPPGGRLLFESEQIEQVLVNLLENACKFTPQGGSIEIRAAPVNDLPPDHTGNGHKPLNGPGYRIDICDSGPGVPAALAEKIFEQYTSYGGGADRSVGGLGLAIARAIVRAHGGVVWATPSDSGGCFSFVLPLSEIPADSPEPSFAAIAEGGPERLLTQ